jgi:hypothetical protein
MAPDDTTRLDATPETASKKPARLTACLECGKSFGRSNRVAEFCGTPCRKAWNNRRMTRGAEIYDLFMMTRYERGIATKYGLWALICALALRFYQEDARDRGGRRSWQKVRTVLEKNVSLRARVLK